MTYYLGKDVNVYMTTEHATLGVSGSVDPATTGSSLAAHTYDGSDKAGMLVASRNIGVSGSATNDSKISDVIGIDFTPGAMNEDISYMGQNTNLSAQVKHDFALTITKKKNSALFDKLFNDHGRDGVYVESGGVVVADHAGTGAGVTTFVHNGLNTSRMQNFGYRVYLVLKDGSEVFVLRNCCITGHTLSLNADGTQEETIELYSYVTPVLTDTQEKDLAPSITGLTAMADI
jgi:hypothetical protein